MNAAWKILSGCLLAVGLFVAPAIAQEAVPARTLQGEVWQYSVAPRDIRPAGKFDVDEMLKRSFHFFWDLADPETALIPDRYPSQRFCSIAAQGFGYTCYVIAADRGWVTRHEAAQRVLKSLRFFEGLPQSDAVDAGGYHGFYYHFLDMDTGRRYAKCELSSIDTTLLMAGVLVCESYFDDDSATEVEIRKIARRLVSRIDWQWMVAPSGHVCMGWKPESGFLEAEWKGYDESILLHVIAAGSEESAISPAAYEKYTSTYHWETFEGQPHINFGPLFGHQYSHMFIDFRGQRDAVNRQRDLDYFENARRATLSQIAYAKANPKNFVGYGANEWGLTACDGPGFGEVEYQGRKVRVHNYSARGIAGDYDNDDGTIAPTAAGGSYPYTPDRSHSALKHFWEMNDGALVGRYGYFDSFNRTFMARGQINETADPNKIWINGDYIGIDQGPILIQVVNHQDGLIWQLMKKSPTIQRGLQRLGFENVRR